MDVEVALEDMRTAIRARLDAAVRRLDEEALRHALAAPDLATLLIALLRRRPPAWSRLQDVSDASDPEGGRRAVRPDELSDADLAAILTGGPMEEEIAADRWSGGDGPVPAGEGPNEAAG